MKNYSLSKTIALSLGVLAMSLLISFVVLAWTGPDSPPPLGNVADLIKMSLGIPQIDISINPSIWIKDTGGGDLIRLETGEGVKFRVENTGKTIIGGEMNMSENRITNISLPLNSGDVASKEFLIDYVEAAGAVDQTEILNRIGENTDTASISGSLFAGQQYIWENRGSFMARKCYLTSASQDGNHNCDNTPSNCCESGFHMCYAQELLTCSLLLSGPGVDETPGGTGGDVVVDYGTSYDCVGWTSTYKDYHRAICMIGISGLTCEPAYDNCHRVSRQWCCEN